MSNEELLFAVFALVVLMGMILQSFWLYKSVPEKYIEKLFIDAKRLSANTPNKFDDLVVDGAEMLYKATRPETSDKPQS
jgi:hypothetical protein